ncbi:MAG TPA: hypothetical protein VIL37_03770 [Natronosporangium sp.]
MVYEVTVDDLTELWQAGAVKLPQVAAQYAEMARELHATALSESHAFGQRTIPGAPSYATWGGPLLSVWSNLRDMVQDDIAVRSYDNLIRAGQVLVDIANGYATTEYLNTSELSQYHEAIEDYEHHPNPDRRPPAYIPEAPSTTDPHPEERPTGGPF